MGEAVSLGRRARAPFAGDVLENAILTLPSGKRAMMSNSPPNAYFDFVYWHDWPNTPNELAKYRVPKRKAGRQNVVRNKKLESGLDDGRIRRFLKNCGVKKN